jgi:hypothetical protein
LSEPLPLLEKGKYSIYRQNENIYAMKKMSSGAVIKSKKKPLLVLSPNKSYRRRRRY